MPRNPFRNPVLKGMYDESLAAYRAKGKTLFLADGLQRDKWDAGSHKIGVC